MSLVFLVFAYFFRYTTLELCMSAFHLMFPYCVARLLVAMLKPSIGDQETLMKQNTARRGNQYTVFCPQITKCFKAILPQLSPFMIYNLFTGNNNHRQSTTIELLLFTFTCKTGHMDIVLHTFYTPRVSIFMLNMIYNELCKRNNKTYSVQKYELFCIGRLKKNLLPPTTT